MKRQKPFFMTAFDERELSRRLAVAVPSIQFVEDSVWPSPTPPTRSSIDECRSRQVYLWNPTVVGVLPTILRKDGSCQGPITGMVVQYDRSFLLKDRMLTSGRIAHGITGTEAYCDLMMEFVNVIWKIVLGAGARPKVKIAEVDDASGDVIVGRVIGGYVFGADAVRWCAEDRSRRLKDRATEHYYRPIL